MRPSEARLFLTVLSCALCALLISSCATVPDVRSDEEELRLFPPGTYIPSAFDWESCGKSGAISTLSFTSDDGSISYHAVRIRLSSPALGITAYPRGKTGISDDSSYPAMRTEDFARKEGCTVALNTTPFSHGSVPRIIGAHTAEGTVYSRAESRYAALVLSDDGEGAWTAKVAPFQSEEELSSAAFVLGGFFAVLLDGEKQDFARHSYEARMGAGTSADGKTLYILMAEKKDRARGLSYQQCAELFRAMGCRDALEFDGGHSTELYVDGRSLTGTAVTRKQAAMLGFTER